MTSVYNLYNTHYSCMIGYDTIHIMVPFFIDRFLYYGCIWYTFNFYYTLIYDYIFWWMCIISLYILVPLYKIQHIQITRILLLAIAQGDGEDQRDDCRAAGSGPPSDPSEFVKAIWFRAASRWKVDLCQALYLSIICILTIMNCNRM